MISIILHNLKMAWRNIIKYRMQNILSVVCLAVGVICLTLCLYLVNIDYNSNNRFANKKNIVKVDVPPFERTDLTVDERIEQLAHLPGVKELMYKYDMGAKKHEVTDRKGNKSSIYISTIYVSPSYLNLGKYHSALTGKRIGVLKPGEVVISDMALENTYGKDCNPTGYRIAYADGQPYVIKDVVNTRKTGSPEKMVFTCPYDDDYYYARSFEYLLLDSNADTDALEKAMQKLSENKNVKLIRDSKPSNYVYAVMALLLPIGSLILIIGIIGYMKILLQLFFARSREMALRRCVGATPAQLFLLLACEIFLILCFTLTLAILLSEALNLYAHQIVYDLTNLYYYMPDIISMEVKVVGCVFLLMLAVCGVAVWRYIHSPLNENVGRSTKSRTTGRSIFLGLQIIVGMIFMHIIVVASVFIYTNRFDSASSNEDEYNKMLYIKSEDINTEFRKLMPTLPAVNSVVRITKLQNYCDTIAVPHEAKFKQMVENEEEIRYRYYFHAVTPNFFSTLNFPLYDKPDEKKQLVPVFVEVGKERLMGKDTKVIGKADLANGKMYSKIGYARIWGDYHYAQESSIPNFYIVLPENSHFIYYNEYMKGIYDGETGVYMSSQFIIKPQEGQYEEAVEQLQQLQHKVTGLKNKLPVKNLWQSVFRSTIWMRVLRNLILILSAVCIVCIVLSVYSGVSLDSRRRRKEIAIRKVNGASRKQIAGMFYHYYKVLLTVCSVISFLIIYLFYCILPGVGPLSSYRLFNILITTAISIIVIATATMLTVWTKVRTAVKQNPSELLNNE